MTTAIVGVGGIGSALARHLVHGGERVVLAAKTDSNAVALADDLDGSASAAPVRAAITSADIVVIAVKPVPEAMQEVIREHLDALDGKIVVDPSNQYNLGPNDEFLRKLPEGQSSAAIVAAMLPAGARYVKAFGTLGAASLASEAGRDPRAALFYATDDVDAAAAIERLITDAGFEPVKAGGLKDAGRLELPDGDLHQWGGLGGKLLDAEQARAAVAAGSTVTEPAQ
jgi:8-hydroxy-5-deazaflavin:NADPH oxidoreductase